MNSLLKRQIRKYLPKEFQSNKELELFLDAVNRSYNTSDDKFVMLQRATSISADELFEASKKLLQETNSQRKVIGKLKNVIDTLNVYDLEQEEPKESSDSLKLVDFIDDQTKEILKINQQKDILLHNLEIQNRELNDYAHMISHDLKSPLQGIEALTNWLIDDYSHVLDAKGKETIELIRQNIYKIDTLVNAVSKYAKIGKISKKHKNLDLEVLVKKSLKQIPISENSSIHIPKKLPTIKGDQYRLEQLFVSLINNAIKHNDKKDKKVEIGFLEKKDFWEFYINDNGNGIEEKYFDKVFIAFSKLESDDSSVGIGLSIAKKIVEAYHGNIWLESEPGIGSTFYFTLKK
jgi:light-regulated signal transduction histidine kinase (bacteriophytochrome)